MKNYKKRICGILLSISLISGYAVAKGNNTITDIVTASGGEFDRNHRDYDILLNAVLAAGLQDALAAPDAELTVFAPNDKAFIRLARDLGFTGSDEEGAFNAIVAALTVLGNGDPIPVLTNVLLYHVSAGKQSFYDLIFSRNNINSLLDGGTITPNFLKLVDNEPDLGNPRFTFPVNIYASNGLIHTINRVLIPLDLPGNEALPSNQSITEIVAASGGDFDRNSKDFDILLNAVIAAGLADALANPEADLTVYAPDDRAFIRLARDLGYRGYREQGAFNAIVEALTTLGNGDPIPLLTNILLYHVSPESKTFKQTADADSIVTLLEGAELTPAAAFLIDGAPQLGSARIRNYGSNIDASNGIIHTISRVLIPLDVAPARRRH